MRYPKVAVMIYSKVGTSPKFLEELKKPLQLDIVKVNFY